MRRIAAVLCLLATAALLPVQAEAARFRLGGRSSASTTSRVVIVPGVAAASRAPAAAGQPERVPFPPATARREEPLPLRLSSNTEARKPWCQTDVVVGGFCMMN